MGGQAALTIDDLRIIINAHIVLLGGGLAVPLEIPIIRSLVCDWQYSSSQGSSLAHILAADKCQTPEIAKLAGAVITAARILNALMSGRHFPEFDTLALFTDL